MHERICINIHIDLSICHILLGHRQSWFSTSSFLFFVLSNTNSFTTLSLWYLILHPIAKTCQVGYLLFLSLWWAMWALNSPSLLFTIYITHISILSLWLLPTILCNSFSPWNFVTYLIHGILNIFKIFVHSSWKYLPFTAIWESQPSHLALFPLVLMLFLDRLIPCTMFENYLSLFLCTFEFLNSHFVICYYTTQGKFHHFLNFDIPNVYLPCWAISFAHNYSFCFLTSNGSFCFLFLSFCLF